MICAVETCPRPVHFNNHCNKHNMQLWRHGRIMPDRKDLPTTTDAEVTELRLARAKEAYESVCGLTGRMFWRRIVLDLEAS